MGYLVIYVSGFVCSLLLFTIGISLFSKIKRRKIQIALSILAFFLMLVPTVLASLIGYVFYIQKLRPSWLFSYTLSWTLLFVVGGVFILITGLKRTDNSLNSSTWPKIKFAKWLLISLTISIATFWIMDRKAIKELESARSEALAIFDSLNYKPIAEKDNSAPILDKTFKLLYEEEFPEWFHKMEEPDFDPAAAEVREFLKGKSETLNILKSAIKMPGYHPEIDFRKHIEFPSGQRAGRLLSLDARLKAKDNEIGKSLDDINAIIRLADHMGRVPALIHALNSNGLYDKAIKALEYVVGQHTLSSSELEKYPSFTPENTRKFLNAGMKGESANVLYTIANVLHSGNFIEILGKSDDFPHFIIKPLLVLYRVFVGDQDITYIREWVRKTENIASLPSSKVISEPDASIAYFKKENRGGILSNIFSDIAVSAYYKKAAKAEAYMTAANIGKAAMQYRLRNRKYPNSIDEMIPQFIDNKPIDPFDGTPVKMKREDKVIIFYSVGENGKDEDAGGDDITFSSGLMR